MSRFDIYKDGDTLVEVLVGEASSKLEEKTADSSTEKHVPFIQEMEDGYLVKVGETVDHPMTPEHWIEFIELIIDGDKVYRHFLTPDSKPEAYFKVEKGNNVKAREHCNIHGLWASNL
ncbi:MAG: desulfoferrodoxin family protein [Bacilli bacterium]